jgi:hypothetical protein
VNYPERELELPFYANGTLPVAHVAAVEREIASNDSCSQEWREVRTLRAAFAKLEEAAPVPPASLYAGVLERIAAERPRPVSAAKYFEPFRSLPRAAKWGLGVTLAACFALFFVQVGSTTHYSSDLPIAATAPDADFEVHKKMATVTAESASAESAPAASEGAPKSASSDARAVSQRRLARTGTIGLIVPDVATTLANVARLTQAQFGAITALQDDAPTSPGGKHTAQVTVSVPDDRFASTLDQVATLGGVTTRSVTTEDLTDAIVDDSARLRNLRHEEADLLRIMDRSGKIDDVLAVEQQLASTRESIEQLDAEAKSMEHRVSYATISIDLSDEKAVTVAVPGVAAQLGDAWHTALERVSGFTIGLIERLFFVVAFLPYVVAAALVLYFVVRRTRERS